MSKGERKIKRKVRRERKALAKALARLVKGATTHYGDPLYVPGWGLYGWEWCYGDEDRPGFVWP